MIKRLSLNDSRLPIRDSQPGQIEGDYIMREGPPPETWEVYPEILDAWLTNCHVPEDDI